MSHWKFKKSFATLKIKSLKARNQGSTKLLIAQLKFQKITDHINRIVNCNSFSYTYICIYIADTIRTIFFYLDIVEPLLLWFSIFSYLYIQLVNACVRSSHQVYIHLFNEDSTLVTRHNLIWYDLYDSATLTIYDRKIELTFKQKIAGKFLRKENKYQT